MKYSFKESRGKERREAQGKRKKYGTKWNKNEK